MVRRMPDIMNKLVPIGLGTAAVVAILVVGAQQFGPASGGAGAAPPSATPSPTAAPTPTPEPSAAAPSASASAGLPVGSSHVLIDQGGVRGTVTVPAPGWSGDGGVLIKNDSGADPPDGRQPGDLQPGDPPPRFERLDPRVVPYWLVSGTFGVVVLAAIGFSVLTAFRAQLGDAWGTAFALAVALFAGMFLWQLIAPPLAYRRWRYSIDDDLLVARYGIIFHEEKAIPVSRLQHVDLTRGQFLPGEVVNSPEAVVRPRGRPARYAEQYDLFRARVGESLGIEIGERS